MSAPQEDKKHRIITELGEETGREELLKTMGQLDKFTVTPPSAKATEDLIAFLKPVMREEASARKVTSAACSEEYSGVPLVLQLVRPQAMLLSKWFILASALVLLAGLQLTNEFNGNTLLFLANASPVLGILTVFYEFRAKLSGVNELEAACPYSPAQLAAARLIVVLGYDILLCAAATPLVSYWQGGIMWQVVVGWLAPLMLMLGIALAVSLRFGIVGGCIVSSTVWALQLMVSGGNSVFSLLLAEGQTVAANLASLTVGILLLLYSYKRWTHETVFTGDEQSD